jgi:hypothetical protein
MESFLESTNSLVLMSSKQDSGHISVLSWRWLCYNIHVLGTSIKTLVNTSKFFELYVLHIFFFFPCQCSFHSSSFAMLFIGFLALYYNDSCEVWMAKTWGVSREFLWLYFAVFLLALLRKFRLVSKDLELWAVFKTINSMFISSFTIVLFHTFIFCNQHRIHIVGSNYQCYFSKFLF